ncbi:MAG: ATP-binding protein [Sodaliphilus sp.]
MMKYPIGIQCFDQIREEGYVYVDKTALVYDLVSNGKVYFLSRPRRFGKSLLVSTLEHYFLGHKHLFQGLAIHNREKEWTEYPVFHISFATSNYTKYGALEDAIETQLSEFAAIYGNEAGNVKDYGLRLRYLIKAAHQITGRRAVVLIDEYDKPLLDVMDSGIPAPAPAGEIQTLEEHNRELLKGLYSAFKDADRDLRFVFLTGITKFSQISVFSGFNQPKDISSDARFDAICGITNDELLTIFKNQIIELGKINGISENETIAKLKHKYDGYHFSKRLTDVFNPFSLLNCFDANDFQNYWFSSGTPTYLMRLMANNNERINELAGKEYPAAEFVDYKASIQCPLPMLYQSGYLTIKAYDPMFDVYLLDFPNEEVRSGLVSMLASEYFSTANYSDSWIVDFTRTLLTGDIEKFKLQLIAFFSNITYRFRRKDDIKECERHFHYTFYLIMQMLGKYNTYVEKETSRGRIDCVLECPNYVYIFEFKLNSGAKSALKQIEEKGYALPYAADSRKLYKVGISFSSDTGNISEFEYI